jgi:hypothetical protein
MDKEIIILQLEIRHFTLSKLCFSKEQIEINHRYMKNVQNHQHQEMQIETMRYHQS